MCCISPYNPSKVQRQVSKQIDTELMRDAVKFKNTIRVLLLGPSESGKSTFLKQMKILHKNGFSDEEKRSAIKEIHDNVHESIYTLVVNLRKFNIQLEQQMSIRSVDYILNIGEKCPNSIPLEYITHVKLLWLDGGIKQLYGKRNKFQLLDCAQYFLDKIEKIYSHAYVPTTEDMLHARTLTKGVHEISFHFKERSNHYDILMIDVGGQREERKKWVQAFDGVKVVLYLAACNEFDQQLRENEGENRLKESLTVFRTVWLNRYLCNAGIIIFLNKTDLLEEKLRQGKRISQYFEDFVHFEKTRSDKHTNSKKDGYDVEKTKEFIKHKFSTIATSFKINGYTKNEEILVQRECMLHFTTATNTENIKKVFSNCQYIIIRDNLKQLMLD